MLAISLIASDESLTLLLEVFPELRADEWAGKALIKGSCESHLSAENNGASGDEWSSWPFAPQFNRPTYSQCPGIILHVSFVTVGKVRTANKWSWTPVMICGKGIYTLNIMVVAGTVNIADRQAILSVKYRICPGIYLKGTARGKEKPKLNLIFVKSISPRWVQLKISTIYTCEIQLLRNSLPVVSAWS